MNASFVARKIGLGRLRHLLRVMPWRDALKVVWATRAHCRVRVYLKPIQRQVCIRSRTTDLACLEKIFVHDEYKMPFDLDPRLIVDAGANIGMATLYFAHHYPQSRIIAIEPEAANFDMLRRNCEGLRNVTLLQGALWPRNSPLEIEDHTVDAWTFRLSESEAHGGYAKVAAITIPDVLEYAGAKRIDLLKVDIEGAELQLFSNGAERWIDYVSTFSIEFHDRFLPGCAQAFYSVLTRRKFVQEVRGENVFVKVLDGHAG